MHVPTETSGSSSPNVSENEPFQMINLAYLVLDVASLSTIHPPPQKKATPSMSKNFKTYGKSSEPIIPSEDKTTVEEGSRSKGFEMRNLTMHAGGTENQMEVERSSIDNELRNEKAEESVPEHVALERRSKKKVDDCVPEYVSHERRSKKKVDHVVNVEELTSDEEPLTNIVTHGIAKRLQRRKGKTMVFEDSPSKEIKIKYGGLKSTPSRNSIGKSLVGPTRLWSKVVTPTRKRKVVSSSDSEFDVKKDVQDIMHVKRSATKKPHDVVLEAPLNNVSLHYVKNVERWNYIIQRRASLERELGKDTLKCKEVVELTEAVGLIKTVTKFGPCYV
ncbi:uncharacterized protein LOC127101744 [Lathyrus oleraceus]|uniref:uncharacterized protein LOC127101744 n=1 Tax=Pisum sativum TaxID=3888 RepID=UPI0021D0BEAE|nr:uncharacterized protein LOC127101744 [Pisum sativum]